MQSLYTLGVRQTTALQADLERLRGGDHSVSLQGTFLPWVVLRSAVALLLSSTAASLRPDISLTRLLQPDD